MDSAKRYTDISCTWLLYAPRAGDFGRARADIPEPEALHQSSHFRTHRSRHPPSARSCLRRPQTGSRRERQRRWIAGEGQLWKSTADHPHEGGAGSLQRWGGEPYLMFDGNADCDEDDATGKRLGHWSVQGAWKHGGGHSQVLLGRDGG